MSTTQLWTKRVAEWRASGLPAARFCDGRGYTKNALYYWQRRLKLEAEAKRPTPLPFARVATCSLPERGEQEKSLDIATAQRPDAHVIVEVGGARVTVPEGAPRCLVETVIEALLRRASSVAS